MKVIGLIIVILLIFLIIYIILGGFESDPECNINLKGDLSPIKSPKSSFKLIYSYGLFSSDPMPDHMIKTIEHNRQITNMDHLVIGTDEVKLDLIEMEKLVPGVTYAYENVTRGVAKSDIARMVSLYLRGGHYADLDVEFYKVPPMSSNAVIIYTETFSIKDKHFTRIANYALSSPPKHPFIKAVISEITKRVTNKLNTSTKTSSFVENKWTDNDVLNLTGPDVITSVYFDNRQKWANNAKNDYSRVIKIGWLKSRQILSHKCAGSWRESKDV